MTGEWVAARRWIEIPDGDSVIPESAGTEYRARKFADLHNAALRAAVEEEREACYAAVEQYFSPENNDCCNHTLATIAGQIRARGGGA